MASWYSNLLTKTSSQISSLRSTLLASEADGDTDDDTHVCRVLRNYYADKGRPLPGWLPADPKAPPPTTFTPSPGGQGVTPLYASSNNSSTPGAQAGGAANLSSLWGNAARAGAGAGQPRMAAVVEATRAASAAPAAGPYGGPGPAGGVPSREGTPSGGASAQDRLRQRFRGGARTTSPGGGTPFQPPPPQGSSQGRGGPGGGLPSGPRAYR